MVRFLCAALCLTLSGFGSHAQDDGRDSLMGTGGVLTLDTNRLYRESGPWRGIQGELDRLLSELQAENVRLDRELSEEEAELAARRPDMEPGEFRMLADAFDDKAEAVRSVQAGKLRTLEQRRSDERQRFLQAVLPILAEIVRDRRGVIVIERQAVFLAADSIDITGQLIQRIDELASEYGLAEGAGPAVPDPDSRPSAQ